MCDRYTCMWLHVCNWQLICPMSRIVWPIKRSHYNRLQIERIEHQNCCFSTSWFHFYRKLYNFWFQYFHFLTKCKSFQNTYLAYLQTHFLWPWPCNNIDVLFSSSFIHQLAFSNLHVPREYSRVRYTCNKV